MTVQALQIECDDTGWVDATPAITGTTASIENQSPFGEAILWRAATTAPGAGVTTGHRLRPGEGFLAETITGLEPSGTATNVYIRAERVLNAHAKPCVFAEFETA